MRYRVILHILALAFLLSSCGDTAVRLREQEALFNRMDSLVNACCYQEALMAGDSLLGRLDSGEDSLRSEALSLMGIANFRLGNMDEAVRYQKDCYDIDRKAGDANLMSSDLNQLAAFSLQAGQYELAKEYILEAIKVEAPLKRDDVLAIRYGLASEIFLKLNDLKRAEDYARKALDIDRQAKRDDKVGVRLSQLAAVLLACDPPHQSEARAALAEAVPLLEAAGNRNSLSIVYCQLEEYEKALDICAETGNKFIEKRALQGLWNKLKKDNPALGATYLERYSTLSDSLVSAEAVGNLNALKVQYETRELQLDNERLTAENRLERVIAIALAVIFACLVAFTWLLRRNRLSKIRMMRHIESVRTSFFTNITHEFRTPLTVILGLSESIADGKVQGDELEKAINIITAQGNGLLGLVNQLLDISKVKSETGRLDWRRGNVVSYMSMVAESYAHYAQRKGIDLQFSPAENNITMDFIPDYIHKVMHNLISNSLKFTPRGGHIYISTNVTKTELKVRLADNGIGIDAVDLPHIFEPFYQGGNTDSFVGTGIGLSLVSQMIKTMDGTVEVKSVRDKGTVFTITLPLRHESEDVLPLDEADKGKQQPWAYESAELTEISELSANSEYSENSVNSERSDKTKATDKPIVLIVEDNDSVVYYINTHIQDRYQVHFAHDGRDGLDKALYLVPDVIVTDLMMPEMDGLTMCEKIRGNELLSHIPIIVVTAKADDEDKLRGLRVGVDAYLIKPFNLNELLVRIDTLIAQRRLLCEKYQRALQAGDVEGDDMAADDRQFISKFVNTVYSLLAKQKPTDLETVAALLNLTSRTLSRKVMAITGDTPLLYINKVKVVKAKGMMDADPAASIADIAYRCGFEDPNYFSRIFKQVEGLTPTAYRRRVR